LPAGETESPVLFDARPLPFDPTARTPAVAPGPAPTERPAAKRTGLAALVAPKDTPVDDTSGGLGWAMAPVRWGGSTGLQLRRNSSSDGAHSSDAQENLYLRASSYIYAPWMAQVAGNLALTQNQGSSFSGTGGAGNESQQKSTGVNGGGSLNLFPISRFPFQATYDVSSSQNSSDIVSSAYTNTRVGLRQSYRPEAGSYSVTGGYDHSTIDSGAQGKDKVGAWFGSFSRNTEVQSLQMSGNYSETTRSVNGESSRLINLNSSHTYQLVENLSYNSQATITDTTLNYLNGTGLSKIHGRFMQFNSFLTWHPEDEDIPLYVNGGVRTLSALNESPDSSSTSQSIGANLSATYTYSPNLAFNGNGLVTHLASSGSGSQMLGLIGGGATYTGDPLTFGKFSYNWNAVASGSEQTGGIRGNNLTMTGQLNHTLQRALGEGGDSAWYFTVGQSVAESADRLLGKTTSLSHNAGMSYRASRGESLNGFASLNASDVMTIGANPGHFRYMNLQLNGQAQFSPRSSGSVNLTFQWSAQNNPVVQSTFSSTSLTNNSNNSNNSRLNIYGSAVYQQMRVFGVQGLRYNMTFNANTLAHDDRLSGDVNGSIERVAYSLENRLDYRVGLLDFQLKGLVTEAAGKKNALIFFKASRDFGRY